MGNTVVAAEFSLIISGYAPLWSGRVTNNKAAELAFPVGSSGSGFTLLTEEYPSIFEMDDYKKVNVQVSVLNRNSNAVWGIPPSSRIGMEEMLLRYMARPYDRSLQEQEEASAHSATTDRKK